MAVAGPLHHGWVEAELLLLSRGEQVVDLEEAVDLEDGFGLGVGAVQLDVAEGPLRLLAALFDPGCQIRLTAPERQGSAGRAQCPATPGWPAGAGSVLGADPGNDHSGTSIG